MNNVNRNYDLSVKNARSVTWITCKKLGNMRVLYTERHLLCFGLGIAEADRDVIGPSPAFFYISSTR